MGSDSVARYGAVGRTDALDFLPKALVIEEDDPSHPHYVVHEDRRKIDLQMVRSMVNGSPIPPIEVSIVGKGKDRYTRVDDGRCRVRHLRVANEQLVEMGMPERTIQATITRGDPNRVRVISNAKRRKDNPLLMAREFADAVGRGRSEAETRDDLGISRPHAERLKALLQTDVEVQRAIGSGQVPLVFVDEVVGKPIPKQLAALEKVLASGAKGQRARATARATVNGDDRPVIVYRKPADAVYEKLASVLPPRESAIVRFLRGDHTAADAHPDLRAALEKIGWKAPKSKGGKGGSEAASEGDAAA